MARHRYLAMLLCYNDGDMLADAIEHLLENRHDIVVWNHGSTDETAGVLAQFRNDLLEVTDVSRDVDFYDLYPLASRHLISKYIGQYHWVSWPDQDEILEGPTRAKPYHAYVEEAVESPHAWIEFNDLVYWFTERDDPAEPSPCRRVRHYSLARHGAMKVRSWRASATNIRWFNHNRTDGSRCPVMFNLRHYPVRSEAQMQRRLAVDRAHLQHGPVNYHYENMKRTLAERPVTAAALHVDDGVSELDLSLKFDWTSIYGTAPKLPREVFEAFVMSTKRWEIAEVLKTALSRLPSASAVRYGADRIRRWLATLESRIDCPMLIALKRDDVKLVSERLAAEWTAAAAPVERIEDDRARRRAVTSEIGGTSLHVVADASARRIRVTLTGYSAGVPPLLALVPCYGGESARVATFDLGEVEFRDLKGQYYYLACEPQARPLADGTAHAG